MRVPNHVNVYHRLPFLSLVVVLLLAGFVNGGMADFFILRRKGIAIWLEIPRFPRFEWIDAIRSESADASPHDGQLVLH